MVELQSGSSLVVLVHVRSSSATRTCIRFFGGKNGFIRFDQLAKLKELGLHVIELDG